MLSILGRKLKFDSITLYVKVELKIFFGVWWDLQREHFNNILIQFLIVVFKYCIYLQDIPYICKINNLWQFQLLNN